MFRSGGAGLPSTALRTPQAQEGTLTRPQDEENDRAQHRAKGQFIPSGGKGVGTPETKGQPSKGAGKAAQMGISHRQLKRLLGRGRGKGRGRGQGRQLQTPGDQNAGRPY